MNDQTPTIDPNTALPVRWESDVQAVGPDEDPRFALLLTLTIAGVRFHAQAFRVRWTDRLQETDTRAGVDYEGSDAVPDDVFQATYMDGPWNTLVIDGAEYALLITPAHDGSPHLAEAVAG